MFLDPPLCSQFPVPLPGLRSMGHGHRDDEPPPVCDQRTRVLPWCALFRRPRCVLSPVLVLEEGPEPLMSAVSPSLSRPTRVCFPSENCPVVA